MKKSLSLIIIGLALVGYTLGLQGQGQINFNPGAGRITFDGAQPTTSDWGQLLIGASVDSLAPVGSPVNFRVSASSGNANLVNGLTLDGIPAGSAIFYQVAAWQAAAGSTYADANGKAGFGVSEIVSATLSIPPASPINSSVPAFDIAVGVIPEPSTIALGVLGGLALMFFRRK